MERFAINQVLTLELSSGRAPAAIRKIEASYWPEAIYVAESSVATRSESSHRDVDCPVPNVKHRIAFGGTAGLFLEKGVDSVAKRYVCRDETKPTARRPASARKDTYVVAAKAKIIGKPVGTVKIFIPADSTREDPEAECRLDIVKPYPLSGCSRTNRCSERLSHLGVALNHAAARVVSALWPIAERGALLD